MYIYFFIALSILNLHSKKKYDKIDKLFEFDSMKLYIKKGENENLANVIKKSELYCYIREWDKLFNINAFKISQSIKIIEGRYKDLCHEKYKNILYMYGQSFYKNIKFDDNDDINFKSFRLSLIEVNKQHLELKKIYDGLYKNQLNDAKIVNLKENVITEFKNKKFFLIDGYNKYIEVIFKNIDSFLKQPIKQKEFNLLNIEKKMNRRYFVDLEKSGLLF